MWSEEQPTQTKETTTMNTSHSLPTRVVRSVTRDGRRGCFGRRVTGRNMLAGRSNARSAAIIASLAGF